VCTGKPDSMMLINQLYLQSVVRTHTSFSV